MNKRSEKGRRQINHSKASCFLNPFLDFSFKKLLCGEANREVAADFLNSIYGGEVVFRDIVLLPVEQMGRIRSDRKAVSDAAGESIDNQLATLEMQQWKEVFVTTRSLFYAANAMVSQLGHGKEFKKFPLKETYHVTLMNFVMDDKYPDNPVRTVKLTMQENGEVFYNNLIFKYLEFPKFNKLPDAVVTREDRWLYALKNMTTFTEIPVILKGDPIFEKLFETARVANLNKTEMTAYIKAELDKMDYCRGLEVSKENGHLDEKISVAEKMLKKRYQINEIEEFTELSVSDILKIAKRLGIIIA